MGDYQPLQRHTHRRASDATYELPRPGKTTEVIALEGTAATWDGSAYRKHDWTAFWMVLVTGIEFWLIWLWNDIFR